MLLFLILGIVLIISGVIVLLKTEIKISTLVLIPDLFNWFLVKIARNKEPEPIYVIRGVLKNAIGLIILLGGVGFCYSYLVLTSLK